MELLHKLDQVVEELRQVEILSVVFKLSDHYVKVNLDALTESIVTDRDLECFNCL